MIYVITSIIKSIVLYKYTIDMGHCIVLLNYFDVRILIVLLNLSYYNSYINIQTF
jgi:hypothetical protein